MFKPSPTPGRINVYPAAARRVAVALFILMVTGCMAHSGGRFTMNDEVDQAFRTGRAQPDHRYYYAGRDTMPYAIIGIGSRYTVPSKYWIPFEPEPEKLKKMSGNMYWKDRYNAYGSQILAPDGTIVGVWFSSVKFPRVKVDQEKRTVDVLYQNPENTRDF